MPGRDDSKPWEDEDPRDQGDDSFSSPAVTRTLPSLDLQALQQQHQRAATGHLRRPGTVQLGLDSDHVEEPTSELPLSGEGRVGDEDPGTLAIARESILQQGAPAVAPPVAGPGRSPLDLLVDLLSEEVLPAEQVLFPATGGDPFDGMMNSTLELRVDESQLNAVAGTPRAPGDVELAWLTPEEAPPARFPNAFALTDEEVLQACLSTFVGVQPPDEESRQVLGVLLRMEAHIVDSFVAVGEAWLELQERTRQHGGEALRALLEPSGALSDPDLEQAVRLWQEDRHDPKFWSDDDGSKRKAVRLVGAYLLRKRGEALCRISRPNPAGDAGLDRLLGSIDQVRRALNARQSLIRKHFNAQSAAFATSFLVQRGPNARPGFFWLEPVPEEL